MSRIGHILSMVAVALAFAGIAAAQTTVGFGGAASDAPETLAQPVVVVKLSGASTQEVTVHYNVTGGTATKGDTAVEPADYALADGDLTFPPGTITKTIPIEVVDDSTVEEPETVLLALSAPTNATLGVQSIHTFTIRDDDAVITPVVEFGATASAGKEPMGTAKLVVVLYPPTKDEVTIDYSVSGGSATAPNDYSLDAGALTFAAWETTKVISLDIVNDTGVEESETVDVRLSNVQGGELGYKETHTFTILDDDKPPEVFVGFQAPQSTVREDVGSTQLTVIVTGGPRTENVIVSYGATGGTAEGGGDDYTFSNGTLTFTPEEAAKTIPIQIVDDTKVESAESVGLMLSDPTGAKLGQYAAHELTIRDNDLPLVSFVQAQSQVEEGSGLAVVGLQLSQASPEPVLVDYTLGGTATQGDDYSLKKGTVSFKPGDTSAIISPDILDDNLDEQDESLVLTLTSPLDAELGTPDVHTLTITDNDAPEKPSVSFETESSMVDEFVPALKIPVQLSQAADVDVTVTLEIEGTATRDEDYTLSSETLTFPAGEIRAFVTGTVKDDKTDESDETVIVTLKDPVNGKLLSPYVHTFTIIDNDYVASELSLFKQEVGTVDGNILTVLGPKALSVELRGIAVDKAGNYYISDWGPTPNGVEGEGGILFWPRNRDRVVRIVTGLTRPGDVELNADQKALLIAGEAGKVSRQVLGVSIRFKNLDPFEGGLALHVFGAGPEKVVKISPDGFFHVPGLLEGDEKSSVDVTLERRGTTKTFTAVPLGQPDGVYGHRIVELEY